MQGWIDKFKLPKNPVQVLNLKIYAEKLELIMLTGGARNIRKIVSEVNEVILSKAPRSCHEISIHKIMNTMWHFLPRTDSLLLLRLFDYSGKRLAPGSSNTFISLYLRFFPTKLGEIASDGTFVIISPFTSVLVLTGCNNTKKRMGKRSQ